MNHLTTATVLEHSFRYFPIGIVPSYFVNLCVLEYHLLAQIRASPMSLVLLPYCSHRFRYRQWFLAKRSPDGIDNIAILTN